MRHTDVVQQKAMKDGSGGIGREFSSLELIWHKLGLEKEQLIGGRRAAPNGSRALRTQRTTIKWTKACLVSVTYRLS